MGLPDKLIEDVKYHLKRDPLPHYASRMVLNVADALGMALQGRTDFLNLFTATQSIRHGQKNTYSQSTGENSKTFNGTPIMQTGAECIKDPSGLDFIVD